MIVVFVENVCDARGVVKKSLFLIFELLLGEGRGCGGSSLCKGVTFEYLGDIFGFGLCGNTVHPRCTLCQLFDLRQREIIE